MAHPLWQQLASAAGLPLTDAQLAQLDRYLDSLIEWNQKMNLTRITDRAQAEVKHIADALTLLRYLPPVGFENRRTLTLADVGTGGGVPGVPLAICRPDLQVTLIDSTKKKLDAIGKMLAAADVINVSRLHARMETVSRKFDVITARAVGELGTLLKWCDPMLKPTSVLLAMKGPKAADEIAAMPMAQRKHFKIVTTPVPLEELPGHVILRIWPTM